MTPTAVTELGVLATDLAAARAAIERLGARLPAVRRGVFEDVGHTLDRMWSDIESILSDPTRGTGSADPGWSLPGIEIRSDREAVVVAVAVTHLRALGHHYHTALERAWPSEVREMLVLHTEWLPKLEERLWSHPCS